MFLKETHPHDDWIAGIHVKEEFFSNQDLEKEASVLKEEANVTKSKYKDKKQQHSQKTEIWQRDDRELSLSKEF